MSRDLKTSRPRRGLKPSRPRHAKIGLETSLETETKSRDSITDADQLTFTLYCTMTNHFCVTMLFEYP